MAKVAVLKVARKDKNIKEAVVKELTVDSSKNTLKVFSSYSITLDEYYSG